LHLFADGLSDLGWIGTPGWLFNMMLGSVILTFLYNSSRGSILFVAVFHAALYIALTSPDQGAMLQNFIGFSLTVCGFAIINVLGRRELSCAPRQIFNSPIISTHNA